MAHYGIVDLSHLFQRVRYGSSHSADADTQVALAIHLLFRSLRKLHRDLQIDHFVFAVDRGSWRYAAYPAYKSRRKLNRLTATPAEQEQHALFNKAQTELVKFLDSQTRCTVLQADQIEGDDFVAHWIRRHPDDQHVIVSSDSDFVQLIAPNVRLYDAINQRTIYHDRIANDLGRSLGFSVNPKDGKIKIEKPENDFVAETDWWKKALFIKLIRGDVGDSIFSAYPGVRYKGKKCSIEAAWEDRHAQGYDWNNLMFQTWDKLMGSDANGSPRTETVRVIDEFKINQSLIDLTMQPADVVERMDQTIAETVNRPKAMNVGMAFIKFCGQQDQPALIKESNDHVRYLNASLPVA